MSDDVTGGGPPTRTIFLGSGAFALPILEAVAGHPAVLLVGIVASPDRPSGRHGRPSKVPVALAAARLGVPLLQPARIRASEATAAIGDLAPGLGVLADFGRIVPPEILDLPGHGILNVHPSLLPRHRGASPIAATILAGDTVAGVSVMRMDAGLDTGPVLASRSWPITGSETGPELEDRAAAEGARLLAEVLGPYLRGARLPVPQDDRAATLTRLLRKADGWLDPGRPATELERRVRAYLPWPGSFVESSAGRLAVLAAGVAPAETGDVPGGIVPDGDGFALVTADGRLRCFTVQPAGGRPMTAAAFRRGHPSIVATLGAGRS